VGEGAEVCRCLLMPSLTPRATGDGCKLGAIGTEFEVAQKHVAPIDSLLTVPRTKFVIFRNTFFQSLSSSSTTQSSTSMNWVELVRGTASVNLIGASFEIAIFVSVSLPNCAPVDYGKPYRPG
jgi:hypothetical protein